MSKSLGKTQGRYLLAVRKGKKNEIFAFKTKHDRAMALDSMARKGKVKYALSEIPTKRKKK